MSMAYTSNINIGKIRIQAIRMLRDGKSTREVSRYLGYAQSTIVKWNYVQYLLYRIKLSLLFLDCAFKNSELKLRFH